MEKDIIKLKNIKLAIAPMAGITDKAFRRICLDWGADISWSEMVSAEGVIRDSLKNSKSLKLAEEFGSKEKKYWVQIFGTNPSSMSKAAHIIEKEIKPLGIDINMGCPVKKAQKAGYGAIQMGRISEMIGIIKEIKETVEIPISLKTRLGLKDSEEILEWAPLIQEAGIDQLVIHARTLKGMFWEEPNWEIIKKLKRRLKIPIVYNGGIKSPEDAVFYAKNTGCTTLMIGQAIMGRPWIFKEIKHYIKTGKKLKIKNSEKKSTIIKHAKLVFKYFGDRGIIAFRTHLSAYLKGAENASELRREAVKIETLKDIEKIVKKIKFRD